MKRTLLEMAQMWFRKLLVVGFALCMTTGCDDGTDENDFDYEPPSGKGAVVIDNLSSADINVYIDGGMVGQVDDDDDAHFDLRPGLHRVVLDEDDGGRRWGEEIDVLAGRLTVLHVTLDYGDNDDFNVNIDFD